MANTNGNARQHSVRMMTPKRSGEYLSDTTVESFDGLSGSKLAERDDESKDWVRSSNAHSAIKDITQTLGSFCLNPACASLKVPALAQASARVKGQQRQVAEHGALL